MPTARQVILVVEDEQSIADTILYALRTEGYEPIWRATGGEALAVVRTQAVSLVVLDVGLPDMSGFAVCRELQALGAPPVIFLTARNAEVDRVVGLELGADDYLAKPFSPRELTARVRAILRRASGQSSVIPVTSRPWGHDEARCRITYRGVELHLTRNEYRLLTVLLAAPGRVYSRDQLMDAAWTDPGAAMDRTVDAHIKTLRAKLRVAAPEHDPIVTHRGMGYALREE